MKNNKDNETKIFGPPGTGKTTYLSKQIQNATQFTDPKNIMVASFTKAAAQEMAGRELPIPEENIGTLHAMCYRALGMPELAETHVKKFNEAFPDYAIKVTSANTDESAIDQHHETKGDEFYSQLQIYRAKMVPRENWMESVRGFAKAWDQFKKDNDCLDFTDLIEKATQEMIFTPNNTTIGIFDEVQDFTALEMRLIRQWGKQYDYFLLAGDDDQTLYSFCGASPDAFLYPDVPKERKRFLVQSYRVPRKIQNLAQRIISQVKYREPKEYKPKDVEGQIYKTRATYKHPEQIIKLAKGYSEQGKSVMILGACAYMLTGIVSALRQEGIPFSNIYKKNRGDWNPLTPGSGISTVDRIQAFRNPIGPTYGGVRLWTPHQLELWSELIKAKDIFQRGAKKRIKQAQMDKMQEDEYVRFLVDVFEAEALDSIVNSDFSPDWILHNATNQKLRSVRFPINIMKRYQEDPIALAKQITVGTIHSVKGAQADVVILLPDLSLQAARQYVLRTNDGFDSILRQFYVGVTRSKDILVIASPANPKYHFRSF
jgi:DNA helicase-2/ATP-dependent DNA helicase PcrA